MNDKSKEDTLRGWRYSSTSPSECSPSKHGGFTVGKRISSTHWTGGCCELV